MAPSQKNFYASMHMIGISPDVLPEAEADRMYEAYIAGWEQAVIHDPVQKEKEREEDKEQVVFAIVITLINLALVAFYCFGS